MQYECDTKGGSHVRMPVPHAMCICSSLIHCVNLRTLDSHLSILYQNEMDLEHQCEVEK